jgi:hypothetical protein
MAIKYNEPITFGRSGMARELRCSGIDFSESGSESWTYESVAQMEFELPFVRQDVSLQIEGTPFLVPGTISVQPVFVFIGGLFTGFGNFTGHAVRTFPVQRNVLNGRPNRLTLVMPNAKSPASLEAGEDRRDLGIRLSSVVFLINTG